MPKSKKSILTTAMEAAAKLKNKGENETEEATTERKNAIKRVVLGAGLIVIGTAGVIAAWKLSADSETEDETSEDEDI